MYFLAPNFMYMIYAYFIVIAVYVKKSHTIIYTQEWAVHIEGGYNQANLVAGAHDFDNMGQIFPDYYHFRHKRVAKRSVNLNPEICARLAVDIRVRSARQQEIHKRVKRNSEMPLNDPQWKNTWYLNGYYKPDMKVVQAWEAGYNGSGVVVTILDDGLEHDHPDIIMNYDKQASYDINDNDEDPTPKYSSNNINRHGTRCAGEVAAMRNNSVCSIGIAFNARIGGVRMLDGTITDAVEARSLSFNNSYIDIYSASWGPDDDGKTVDGPGVLATRAFVEGVAKGRSGKGSIFIWASGNGGRDDNCNCDGYTNSIYTLTISSATQHEDVPWYNEPCSSTLASTYSSGSDEELKVVTIDLNHACTTNHTGTSAAAPLAAGICALTLQANPQLTWRDMQHIVVHTAKRYNLYASDWQLNGVGRNVSHNFGYGLMDAEAMVKLAATWTTVPAQHKCDVVVPIVNGMIHSKQFIDISVNVNRCEGVEVLEHVQANLTIHAIKRGDIVIYLISPQGTNTTLLTHRPMDRSRNGFRNWPFMSVHFWGESPFGVWKLRIHNLDKIHVANISNWSLILYGTQSFGNLLVPQDDNQLSTKALDNSIQDAQGVQLSTDGEVRKNRLKVEEESSTASSGCLQYKSGVCLECDSRFTLKKGTCRRICTSTLKHQMINNVTNLTGSVSEYNDYHCSPCHYSCLKCWGKFLNQCIECFPDNELIVINAVESYCYQSVVLKNALIHTWYFKLCTFVIVSSVALIILFLWKMCHEKCQTRKYSLLNNTELEHIDEEETFKMNICSDTNG